MRQGGIEEEQHSINATFYLASSAIHNEILTSMDASTFVSTLRWFFSTWAPAPLLRFDQCTNFAGAKIELYESMREKDHQTIAKYLSDQGCTGQFNSPYARHLGGVCERRIGKIKRILAAMLLETKGQNLTRELLVILMSAVSATVNAHHDHTFRFGWTPPTDTFHVANTEDPSSRPSLRKIYVSRSVCSKEVECQADQFCASWRGEYL